jgi:hypothetical protein
MTAGRRPRVLFVVSIVNYAREWSPVIESYARHGHDVHVLVGWTGASAAEHADGWLAAGCTVHDVPEQLKYGEPPTGPAPEPATVEQRTDLRFRAGIFVHRFRALADGARRMIQARRFGRAVLEELQPALIVGGPYGGAGTFDHGIARAAHALGIPRAGLSYTAFLGERFAIEERFWSLGKQGYATHLLASASLAGRVIARLFPNWTRTRHGVTIFRFDPVESLLAQVLGLGVANPWQRPPEDYDAFFTELELTRRLLIESGYDASKLAVVGKPLLDDVFAKLDDPAHEQVLLGSLDIEPGTPFLLVNVEPSFEHRYASWDRHWELFRATMDALARAGVPVVLSLHPYCAEDNYRFVEDDYGFRIARDRTIGELYPYAAGVVSYPSSTNALSLVFGTPLVLYDWWDVVDSGNPAISVLQVNAAALARTHAELEDSVIALVGRADFGRRSPRDIERVNACDAIRRETAARFGV